MGDFSRLPLEVLLASQQKGYIGLHIEQGVPIRDQDLNLLHDLLAAGMRSLFTRYVGDGVAAGTDGFAVQALPAGQNRQNFQIAGPGSCLVGGVEVNIPAPVSYNSQRGNTPLTTPGRTQPDPRIDTVFLDVFLVEVDGTTDPDLTNSQDVGMQTSVRIKPDWVVRVSEGVPMPQPAAGHGFHKLAELRRPRGNEVINATMITDLRQRGLTVSDLERRLGLLERVLLLPAFATTPFTPQSGLINGLITLNGTNFTVGGAGSVAVLFGDRPASLQGTPSATQLQARVPPEVVPAGTSFTDIKITVRNAGGVVVSDGTFRAARVLPAPTFGSPPFSPTNGIAGDIIELNGDNFNWPPVTVRFGTTNAEIVGSLTHTQIRVRVPTGLAAPGAFSDVRIEVTTPGGTVTSTPLFRAGG
ncbi:MAG: hypothetical protein ACRDTA_24810 [Pseudonocardiaceae bacterium]